MATVNDETAQNLSKSEEEQKEEKKEVPKEDPKVTEKVDVDKKEETLVENEKKVEVKKEEEEEVEDDEEEVEEEEEIEEIIIEEEVETEDEIEVEADNKKVIEEIKEEKPQVETAPEKDNENKMSEATETTKPSATEEEVKEEKTEENQKAVESFVKLENLDENEENDKKLVIEEKKEEEVKEEVQIKIENEENSNAKKNDEIDGLKMLLQEQQQKLIQANQQLTNLANKQQQQQQQQQTPSPIFMKYDEQLAQQQQQLASMFTKYDEQQQSQQQQQQQQKPTFYEKQQQQQTQKQHQIPIFYEKQQQQPQPPQQYVEQQQQHQYQPEKKQQQQTFNETNYHLQKQQPPTLLSSYNQEQQHHHEESTTQKQIDLQKIFTPAEDAEYISPKNRKLYASSAFYAQGLHPTVEDQVELARRISHSLSDISNQQSKGQSMYVNRKKRSVKWVHEGQGHVEEEEEIEEEEETKENIVRDKIPLKLIMNPSGQIRDIYSLKESANLTNTGLLSPEKCAQLVSALQEHKGKGAELFAKRRKKSEKWIVEATPTSTRSTNEATNIADYQQQQQQSPHCQGGGVPYKAPTSPNLLPAYSEAGKHRVQLNLHQEQLLQKYVKPELRVVKTPWEAALETGSASTAFVEAPQQRSSPYLSQQQQQRARSMTPMPTHTMQQQQQQQQQLAQQPKPYQPTKQYQPPQQQQQQQQSQNQYPEPTFDSHFKLPKANQSQQPMKYCSNYQRDLAYKPSVPQGWKSSSVNLPTANDILAQQQQETLERQQELCNEIIRQIEADLKDVVENYENDVEEVEQEKKCVEEEEQQQQHRPEFIDHLIRSPELRLSPMGYQNIHAYDKTVQELYDKQQQQQQKEDLQQLKDATTKRLLRQHNIELEQSLSQDKEEKKESDEREEDEYVKVAVGDLINAFEKQTIQQQQQQQRQQQQQKQQTELYVPREIPLESYKPPPPMPTVLNTPTPTVTPTFPSSNTWSPMKSLPKQQFVPQKSYEPVKTLPTSPPMGGVNYTPAPLNQQKLEPWSKFPTSNSSPTNRYSGPSFNNAARGWQKGAHPMVNTKAYAPPRPTVEHRGWKVPEQLPYTDF